MTAPWYVTPGVYPEVTPAQYHAAPIIGGSVTSSVLRKITPPEFTPAHARYYLDAPREEKGYFDVGSAYHVAVLGRGGDVVSTVADDWKSPTTRAWRDEQYALGKIPLLQKDLKVVSAMHTATMAHPDCARFFEPGTFTPELAIVWRDERTGLLCRAMIDFVPDYGMHMILGDLKSKAGNASPSSVSKSMADYGYHQQLAHYRTGALALGLAETVTPVLVVCGKDAPHVPLCRAVDMESIEIGEVCNRKALDLYAACLESGMWPGYDDPGTEHQPIGLPGWKRYQFRAARGDGVYDVQESELF